MPPCLARGERRARGAAGDASPAAAQRTCASVRHALDRTMARPPPRPRLPHRARPSLPPQHGAAAAPAVAGGAARALCRGRAPGRAGGGAVLGPRGVGGGVHRARAARGAARALRGAGGAAGGRARAAVGRALCGEGQHRRRGAAHDGGVPRVRVRPARARAHRRGAAGRGRRDGGQDQPRPVRVGARGHALALRRRAQRV